MEVARGQIFFLILFFFNMSDTLDFNADSLVACAKIASIGKSFGSNSQQLTFVIKQFSKEKKKDSCNIFVHNTDTLRNAQFTRNDFGVRSYDPVLLTDLLPIGTIEDQIYYLRDGCVWGMLLSGGESFLVCKQPVAIESFKVFQGSENRVFLTMVMDVYPNKSPAETAEQDALDNNADSSGVVFNQLMVRHWDSWGTYKKRHHIFVCPLEVAEHGLLQPDTTELVDLMLGLETDCPGKAPGMGAEEYCVSPDGQHLVFASRRTELDGKQLSNMAWSTDIAIYLVGLNDVVNNSAAKPLPVLISGEDWRGTNSHPCFSPDGKKIAFLSAERPGYESDKFQIRIYDMVCGELYSLTQSVDLSFQSIEWDLLPEGEELTCNSTESSPVEQQHVQEYTIYATAGHRASVRLFRLHFSSVVDSLHFIEVMDGDESRSSPIVVPVPAAFKDSPNFFGGRATSLLYYVESSLNTPHEIKRAVLAPQDTALFIPFVHVPLTAGAAPLLSNHSTFIQEVFSPAPQFSNGDVAMPEVTQHYFEGAQGDLVHCWYVHPLVREPAVLTTVSCGDESHSSMQQSGEFLHPDDLTEQSVPLVVVIHGGPQSAMLNNWNYRWNLSLLAAQGYGVLAVNFHGSTGFGMKFCDSIRNDWGGKPFEDIMTGTDHILAQFKYLDSSRTAALGPSFGGYMINWINGHTDRFKCLVCHDGVFSLRSQYFSNDELWFAEWEFGLPWEAPEQYAKWSPDSFVGNWKTPTLVIHGGKDYRVCETEGIGAFTALQRKGVPSQFLYFRDENHWVLKPLNSLKWHRTVFTWLHQWLDRQVDAVTVRENGQGVEVNEGCTVSISAVESA